MKVRFNEIGVNVEYEITEFMSILQDKYPGFEVHIGFSETEARIPYIIMRSLKDGSVEKKTLEELGWEESGVITKSSDSKLKNLILEITKLIQKYINER